MLDQRAVEQCLTFTKYIELEKYVSALLKDKVLSLIKLETEVWQKLKALDLEKAVAEYVYWDPYVKDYVMEEILILKSATHCLISMLRIIYYKKSDFTHSGVSF